MSLPPLHLLRPVRGSSWPPCCVVCPGWTFCPGSSSPRCSQCSAVAAAGGRWKHFMCLRKSDLPWGLSSWPSWCPLLKTSAHAHSCFSAAKPAVSLSRLRLRRVPVVLPAIDGPRRIAPSLRELAQTGKTQQRQMLATSRNPDDVPAVEVLDVERSEVKRAACRLQPWHNCLTPGPQLSLLMGSCRGLEGPLAHFLDEEVLSQDPVPFLDGTATLASSGLASLPERKLVFPWAHSGVPSPARVPESAELGKTHQTT